ncbi:hypothetical protein HYT05_03800, partial [Candidatus Kaiserbacteria bacterium]|nr:hypothetical protein [Candidatus Kaiserbacteria bacterium]
MSSLASLSGAANGLHFFGWLIMTGSFFAFLFFVFTEKVFFTFLTVIWMLAFGFLFRDWGIWWFQETHPILAMVAGIVYLAAGIWWGTLEWVGLSLNRA